MLDDNQFKHWDVCILRKFAAFLQKQNFRFNCEGSGRFSEEHSNFLDVFNYRQECFSQAETSTMESVGIFCNLGNITAVGVNDCVVSMHLYGGVTSW